MTAVVSYRRSLARVVRRGSRASLCAGWIFTGATVFAAILLWRYGLIRLMVVSDRTYLSVRDRADLRGSVCSIAFGGPIVISREGDAGQRGGGPHRDGRR